MSVGPNGYIKDANNITTLCDCVGTSMTASNQSAIWRGYCHLPKITHSIPLRSHGLLQSRKLLQSYGSIGGCHKILQPGTSYLSQLPSRAPKCGASLTTEKKHVLRPSASRNNGAARIQFNQSTKPILRQYLAKKSH